MFARCSLKRLFVIGLFFIGPLLLISWNSYGIEGLLGKFSMPLISEEGTQEGFVNGESATFLNENEVKIIKADCEVVVPAFPNPWNLKAPQCVFKKQEQRIVSNSPSILQTKGLIINGDGMEWMLNKGRITFFENVTVEINNVLFKAKKS